MLLDHERYKNKLHADDACLKKILYISNGIEVYGRSTGPNFIGEVLYQEYDKLFYISEVGYSNYVGIMLTLGESF